MSDSPVIEAPSAGRKHMLRWRLFLPLATLGVVLILLGVAAAHMFLQKRFQENLETMAHGLVDTIEALQETLDSTADHQRIVVALASEPGVNKILVASKEAGSVLLSSQYALLQAPLAELGQTGSEELLRDVLNANTVEARTRLYGNEFLYAARLHMTPRNTVANVRETVAILISLDTRKINEHVALSVYLFTGGASVGFVVLLVVMFWLIQRQVLSPLRQVRQQLAEGAEAHPTLDLGPASNDHIAPLIDAINRSHWELRNEHQEKLRLLSNIVEQSTMGIVVTDALREGNPILYANAAYCELSGYSMEELEGRNPNMMQGPETDPDTVQLLRDAVREQRRVSVEIVNYHKDGTSYWRRLNIFPIRDAAGRVTHFVGYKLDVTADHRAREEMKRLQNELLRAEQQRVDRSEKRFVDMVDGLDDPLLILDEGLLIRYANRAVSSVFGQASGTTLGCDFRRFLHPEEADLVSGRLKAALQAPGETQCFEHWYCGRDEAWEIVESAVTCLLDIEGHPTLMLHMRCVTLRKQMDEKLSELSEAVEQATEGVVIAGLSGIQRYVNQAWARMHGLTQEQMVGRHISECHTEDQMREQVNPALDRVREHGTYEGEIEHLRQDGSVFTTMMTATLLQDSAGVPYGMMAVARDVTESKKAAAALQASESRLSHIVNVSPAVIYTRQVDEQFTFTFMGSKAKETFGYDAAMFVKDPHFWTSKIHPEDRERTLAELERVFSQGKAAVEYRFLCADHSYRWVHDEIAMTLDALGEPLELVGACLDVTERKRAAQLEFEVLAAEASNRAKSAFLATMSHEIRTPMNGVVGTVDVLRQTALQTDQLELVDIIRDSAMGLLGIINDILDFSKIEAGKIEVELLPLILGDLVESVCATLNPVALDKGVELLCYCDPSLPDWVLSDSVRLRQILTNLIGNAIKFSAGQKPVPRVKVRAEKTAGGQLRLIVADNGIGMSTEVVGSLFKPFTQADGSITRRFGGTGLGLSICKGLAEMLNGVIEVSSRPDYGSVFTVTFPMELPEDFHQPPHRPGLHGVTVLLLSGDSERISDWRTYLEHAGAEVQMPGPLASMATSMPQEAISSELVVLLDAAHERAPLPEIRKVCGEPHPNTRYLLIATGQSRFIRQEDTDAYLMNTDILRRDALLHAVALACGREKPMVETRRAMLPEVVLPPSLEDAVAQGRLILVAEDNDINQKVIRHQLAIMGFACEIAANGEEALLLWRTHRHALLISDLHMPVMDGYTLASAIRAEEAAGEHIPIIAFTANISKGERERCAEAGMDGYLTKPAPMDMFKLMLEKWLPSLPFQPEMTTGRTSGRQEEVLEELIMPILDTSILAEMIGNDPALIAEFLADYLGSLSKSAAEIRAAAAEEDWSTVGSTAHRLKSSSRSVGAAPLGDCCEQLEKAGKCGDAAAVTEIMATFERLTTATVNAITRREQD